MCNLLICEHDAKVTIHLMYSMSLSVKHKLNVFSKCGSGIQNVFHILVSKDYDFLCQHLK